MGRAHLEMIGVHAPLGESVASSSALPCTPWRDAHRKQGLRSVWWGRERRARDDPRSSMPVADPTRFVMGGEDLTWLQAR